MRFGGFGYRLVRPAGRRWLIISYAALAMGAGLTLARCSDGEVTSTVCRGGETKSGGECVAASSYTDNKNSPSPVVTNPNDPGDPVDPSILSYDPDEATFSIAMDKIELSSKIKNQFKEKFSDEDDKYEKAYPVSFTVVDATDDTDTNYYYGWQDVNGYLEAHKAFSIKKHQTAVQGAKDINFTDIVSTFGSMIDENRVTEPYLSDCMVLPGKHAIERAQQRGKFTSRIWFEDGDVKIKFIEEYKYSEQDEEAKRTESVEDLKQLLGLQSYSVEDVRVAEAEAQVKNIGELMNRHTFRKVPKKVEGDDSRLYIKNKMIDSVIVDWNNEEQENDLEDDELCFHKLYAKQHGSLNEEPGSSAKIYAYKAVTYAGYADKDSITPEKIALKKGDYNIAGSDWMFDPTVTFYHDPSDDPSLNSNVSLSLRGASYLINASEEHKDDFTGRAAPDEEEFVDSMVRLIQFLVDKQDEDDD